VDFVFVLALVILYAATRWLIGAVSRLGGVE
jgi:HAMP domain-containing protein